MLADKIKIVTSGNITISMKKLWDDKKRDDEILYAIIDGIAEPVSRRLVMSGDMIVRDDITCDEINGRALHDVIASISGKKSPAQIRIITSANNNINFGIMYWFQERVVANKTDKINFFKKLLNVFKQ